MNSWETGMVGLLTLSLRGAVLIALVFGLRWIGSRWLGGRTVFACWLIAAAVLLLPWQLPVWRTHLFTAAPTPTMDSVIPAMPRMRIQELGGAAKVPNPQISPVDVETVSDATARDPWAVLALIWGLGVIGLAGWRGVAAWRWSRDLRKESEPGSERLIRLVEACREASGLRMRVKIRLTDLVGTPALTGCFRPCLLLPRFMAAQLSDTELRHVILHELGHARRGDLWAMGLLQLACYVHWFNPLVWLAMRTARHDCELACDEWVLGSAPAVSGSDYGHTLIKILSMAKPGRGWMTTVGMAGNKRHLLKRVARIGGHRQASRLRTTLAGLALGSLALVGFSREKSAEPSRAIQPTATASTSVGNSEGESSYTGLKARENAVWELRSVGEVGGIAVAIIDVDGEPYVVREGTSVLRHSVRSIDVTAKQIVLSEGRGQQQVLAITRPEEVTYPQIDQEWRGKLIKEYLNDGMNFQMTRELPGPLLMSWSSLSRKGKEAILLNYLSTGMLFSVTALPTGGGISVSSGFLFSNQVQEYRQKHRQAFLDSLSDYQRLRFQDGLSRAINFTVPPDEMKKQAALSQSITDDQVQVVAELTPAQMKLFEAWTGGTTWPPKPKPRPKFP